MSEKDKGKDGKVLPFTPREEAGVPDYLQIDSQEMDEHELLIGLMALISVHLSIEELREEFAHLQKKIKSKSTDQK